MEMRKVIVASVLILAAVILSGCVGQRPEGTPVGTLTATPAATTAAATTAAPTSTESTQQATPSASLTSDFTPPTGKTSGPGETGPWNMRLMIATSSDGLTFTRTNKIVTDQGDVPDIIQDSKGWIYLYYTGWTVGNDHDETVVAISTDKGDSWVYKKLVFSGFEGMSEPVDPDIVILPDGTFRLYVTSDSHDGNGPRTYYAEGTDGINFSNKGVAFSQPGKNTIMDPTVLQIGNTWYYFAGTDSPDTMWYAKSTDGKTFSLVSKEPRLTINGEKQMMVNGIAVPGGYRFYASAKEINSFFTTDGKTWTPDAGSRLTSDTSSGLETAFIKEPAVVKLSDGNYLMVYAAEIP